MTRARPLTDGARALTIVAMALSRRLVAAALVAPLLVLAVSAWGFVGLRCRMTGMVSLATCCPVADAADDATPAQSTLSEPGCCDRVVVELTKPPASPSPSFADDVVRAPRALAAPAPLALAPPPLPAPRALVFEPPRARRPPLPLLKRSLLI